MTTLVYTFGSLLRLHPRVIRAIPSRRYLVKDEVACNNISSALFEGSNSKFAADSDQYPQIKGRHLEPNFLLDKIQKWLHCTSQQAESIVIKIPSLKVCHLASVEDYINFMKDMGVDTKLVLHNPWLLNYSLSTMRERISLLMQVEITQDTVHLLRLRTGDLKKIVQRWILDKRNKKYSQNSNRLKHFSKHLNCTAEQLAIQMEKHCSLLTRDFDTVSTILFLLLDHNVSPRDIRDNVQAFKFKLEPLKQKLTKAREANANVRIWMLRYPRDHYEEIIAKIQNLRCMHVEDVDIIDILVKGFKCSRSYAECLGKRFPRLLRFHPTWLSQNFDMYYEFGFTPEDLRFSPYALLVNSVILRNRLQELSKLGLRPINVRTIVESETFQDFVKEHQVGSSVGSE